MQQAPQPGRQGGVSFVMLLCNMVTYTMKSTISVFFGIFVRQTLFAITLYLCCSAAFPEVREDIGTLLQQERYTEAYHLGKVHEELLGDPLFDFYFGVAAVNAGAPGEGVLAIERYLLVYPDNRHARFHAGRAYYILGEDLRAREVFASLREDANLEELDTLNKYADAIKMRESRYMPTAQFFVEAGLGYDRNINAGIRPGEIAGLPEATVQAGALSARAASGYSSLQTGGSVSYPVRPGLSLYGGLVAGGRWHAGAANDTFDQTATSAQGGVSLIAGRNLYRLGLEYNLVNVDQQRYLGMSSLVGEWSHQFDQFDRMTVAGQYSQLRYDDITIYQDRAKTLPLLSGAPQRDSELYLLSAGWTHTFPHLWAPVVSLGVNVGREKNVRGRSEYSRQLAGVRGSLAIQPWPQWLLSGGLAYQYSGFAGHFAGDAALPRRRDGYAALELAAAYVIDREWSIKLEGLFVEQFSNIGLFDYGRNNVALKLRYDFK